MNSPYVGLAVSAWGAKTEELIQAFPLSEQEVVAVVLDSWVSALQTRIGSAGYQIGKDIYPQAQIMGFFLHELVPLELEDRYPSIWSRDSSGYGKDVVCKSDPMFSFEIKTSSHKSQIFGNRSHTQVGQSSKKDKSGYYLAINFGKFDPTQNGKLPIIHRIRLGWLDSSDWQGQLSQTGQSANLPKDIYNHKLKELYTFK